MRESLSSYFKIIPFAIKNKFVIEFINLKWQKDTDRWRRKRVSEYEHLSISPDDVISKIFPKNTFNSKILSKLEFHLDDFIKIKKEEKYPTVDNPYPVDFGLTRSVCRLLYALCFFHKPDIVVETGVANGFSSSYILLALDQLGKGELISIDKLVRPWHTKEKIGYAIPKWLRHKHKIIVVNASTELKKLLESISIVDIFIHDSSHTYQNMINEFRIAWAYIKKGGYLLSDDISQNDAFLEFSDEVGATPIIVKGKETDTYFGIIQKS